MILIIGLGNPGIKYENTRHNIGFAIIDNLQSTINNFSDWKQEKKLLAKISNGKIDKEKIILTKPQTFMNNSGVSVKKIIRNWKTSLQKVAKSNREIKNLIVIHDDVDLPLGKIKIVKNRGAGGHKGVQSIINELKTKNFIRIRIGIKPKIKKLKNVEKFVLQKFNEEEKKIVKKITEKACQAIDLIINQGIKKAMNNYNKKFF